MTKSLKEFEQALSRPGFPSLGEILRRRRRSLVGHIKDQGVVAAEQVVPYLEQLMHNPGEFSYEKDFFEALLSIGPINTEDIPDSMEPTPLALLANPPSLKSLVDSRKKKGKAGPVSETPAQEESDVPSETESFTKE